MAKAIVKAVPELGFRRAGMFFSRDGREVDVDDKTLAILKAERSLLVVELPADAVATWWETVRSSYMKNTRTSAIT